MVKKHMKHSDGKYHIKGQTFNQLKGSRAQVWHKNAFKTEGGLTRDKLMMNKHGRVVSKSKHKSAKRENVLGKAGYKTRKGVFGSIKKGKLSKNKKSKSKSKSRSKTAKKSKSKGKK